MIAAVVLAAGMSRRMGHPKQTLPWGPKTVIEHLVHTLLAAQVDSILVVTGAAHAEVKALLAELPVQIVFNPEYQQHEMLFSVKLGLQAAAQAAPDQPEAALICLGDQPQMRVDVIQAVLDGYSRTHASLVIPSFHRRRGHPWLVARSLWDDILQLGPNQTLRDFIHDQQFQIHYVEVDTDSVLQDIDTPEDYQKFQS